MITHVTVKNFKSLKQVDVETRPLTLLYGLNGSGKSSFLQALLFFGRNLTQASAEARLNDAMLRLGRQRDAFYCYNALRGSSMSARFTSDANASVESRFLLSDFDRDTINCESLQQEGDCAEMIRSLSGMQYISAARPEPTTKARYESSVRDGRNWGRQGENALSYLFEHGDDTFVEEGLLHDGNEDAAHRSLRMQVNAWLSDIAPGAAVHLSRLSGADDLDVTLSFQTGENAYNFRPENVGFGLSIVLPLIVMLLSSKRGDMLLLENPEAHLHPGGQSRLGRLLSKVARSGVQLFVETHSDHVINGVRVALKERVIGPDDVNVLFFERKLPSVSTPGGSVQEQYSTWKELHLDAQGEFDDYPPDFMDEWNRQVAKLWL